jgi:hypothetical protein
MLGSNELKEASLSEVFLKNFLMYSIFFLSFEIYFLLLSTGCYVYKYTVVDLQI